MMAKEETETGGDGGGFGGGLVLNESLAVMLDFLPNSAASRGLGAAAGLEIPTLGWWNCVKHEELC